ncbi:MAG: hypothetical protein AAFP86_21065, partial [Planctomycetota bacterium]
ELLRPLTAILVAGSANAAVAFGVERVLDGPLGRTAALGLAIAAGGATFLGLGLLLGVPGVERFRRGR